MTPDIPRSCWTFACATGLSIFRLLRVLYWIYERRLLRQIRQKPMPRHIGIILDGNRRHGLEQGLTDP